MHQMAAANPALRLYQLTSGASTTRFAYDGLDQIADLAQSTTLSERYWGPASGALEAGPGCGRAARWLGWGFTVRSPARA